MRSVAARSQADADKETMADAAFRKHGTEEGIDELRGIAEIFLSIRDTCNNDGDKHMALGLQFLSDAMHRNLDVLEDALYPGRRDL